MVLGGGAGVRPRPPRYARSGQLTATEEGPGILNRLAGGSRRCLAGGDDLTGPGCVRVATTARAETEDRTGRFLAGTCRLEPGARAEQAQPPQGYEGWCRREGVSLLSPRSFSARVRETVGPTSPKGTILSGRREYCPGIGLPAREGDA
ncbi:hypothetical protein ACWG5P_33625 [Streptomyces prasinus]